MKHRQCYRFCDPNLQRWLSRDPIEETGSINLYMVAYNNPVNLADLLGLDIGPIGPVTLWPQPPSSPTSPWPPSTILLPPPGVPWPNWPAPPAKPPNEFPVYFPPLPQGPGFTECILQGPAPKPPCFGIKCGLSGSLKGPGSGYGAISFPTPPPPGWTAPGFRGPGWFQRDSLTPATGARSDK